MEKYGGKLERCSNYKMRRRNILENYESRQRSCIIPKHLRKLNKKHRISLKQNI
jgi:hypothetical protein